MSLNLKMTVERSKRRSHFLSLVFITKCFNKNLLLRILFILFIYLVGAAVASWLVSALVSGSSGPDSSPGRGHCVVFLGKTLYSHNASLYPGV